MTGDPRIPEVPIDATAAPFGTELGDIDLTGPSDEEAPVVLVAGEDHDKVVAERDEYLDALQRLKAEFDNYRRRVDRDLLNAPKAALRQFVATQLPVFDNLGRALGTLANKDASPQVAAAAMTGINMIYAQFEEILHGHGVSEIEAEGKVFDPNRHEAVAARPVPPEKEGLVVQVYEKGYVHDDSVIRPAKVVVGRHAEPDDVILPDEFPKDSFSGP